jgi:tetratricopeptide (TPR) repeat protein
VINGEVGMFFVYDEQYERAIEEMRPAQLWNPDFPSLLMSLTRAHAMLGHDEVALSMVDSLEAYFRDNYLAWGFISAALVPIGREDDVREFYEEALAASESSYIAPGVLGFVAASIGDHDAAFRHFEEGLEQRSLVVSWLRDPLIAGIRQDARYAALMRRIGLDP